MKILHLEDVDDDAELIEATLRRIGCEVTRVETRNAFVQALADSGWDIILADYSMPSFDGMSALKLVVEKYPGLPFIFVTGSLGEERAVETLKNGATDYILKHRLERPPQAVTRAKRESETVKAQQEAERKLKASLHEKDLLLREVHHRVKNNLQIICSLLHMQSGAVSDSGQLSVLQESQKRVQSMATIHEMLYGSASLHDVDFAEYIRRLASEISYSYGIDRARIQVTFELDPIRFDIHHAIPCGLILNELLSNAFKYAFINGRSGEVRISLKQQEGCIRMAVEDNGVGMPDGYAQGGLIKSLGLRIVDILTDQLDGSMKISSDHGAHFVLKFGDWQHSVREEREGLLV